MQSKSNQSNPTKKKKYLSTILRNILFLHLIVFLPSSSCLLLNCLLFFRFSLLMGKRWQNPNLYSATLILDFCRKFFLYFRFDCNFHFHFHFFQRLNSKFCPYFIIIFENILDFSTFLFCLDFSYRVPNNNFFEKFRKKNIKVFKQFNVKM